MAEAQEIFDRVDAKIAAIDAQIEVLKKQRDELDTLSAMAQIGLMIKEGEAAVK
jgi:hypothetical protein